jgi:hypothetical protein
VGYYDEKGILLRVNGMGDIPEIQKRVLAVL